MEQSPGTITVLLAEMRAGNQEAASSVMRLIYPELRRLAAAYLRRERAGHSLQPTELVNELYLRLAAGERDFQNSAHLRAVAAQGMRNILVDHARARRAAKRGAGAAKIDLEGLDLASPAMDENVLALEDALSRLSEWDPRQARVVELRFYGGLSEEEIGEVLGMSARTVKRDWKQARAWLYSHLKP